MFEIYVRPFSNVAGGPQAVSTAVARNRSWARAAKSFLLAPSGAVMVSGSWGRGRVGRLGAREAARGGLLCRHTVQVGSDVRHPPRW